MKKYLLMFLSVLMLISNTPVMAEDVNETSIDVTEVKTTDFTDVGLDVGQEETNIEVTYEEDVGDEKYEVPVQEELHEDVVVEEVKEAAPLNILLVATSDKGIFTEKDSIISEYDGLFMVGYENESDLLEAYDRLSKVAEFVERDSEVFAAEGEAGESDIVYTEESNPLSELETELSKNETFEETKDNDLKVVALLDSGVRNDSHVIGRVSMLGDYVDDDYGHGNEMLDVMIKTNPNIKVLSVKVLDSNGKGSISSIIAGMEYAIEQGADIINLSLSAFATSENSILKEYVLKAKDAGMVVVGAAGNNNKNAKYFVPANIDEVVVVGMGTANNEVKYPSNYGDTVDYLVDERSTSAASASVAAMINKNGSIFKGILDGNYIHSGERKIDNVIYEEEVDPRLFTAARTIETVGYVCVTGYDEDWSVVDYHNYDSGGCKYGHWGPDGEGNFCDCYMCPRQTAIYGGVESAPYGQGNCQETTTTIQSYDYSVFGANTTGSSIFAEAGLGEAVKNVKRIERASANKAGSVVVSDYMSNALIYAWIEGDTLKWYCSDSKVYLNPNSDYFLLDFQKLESLDLSVWDMSKVTSMTHFYTRTHALSAITMSANSKLMATANGLGGYWIKEGWDADTEYQIVIDANGRQQAKKVANRTLKAAGAAANELPDSFEGYWNSTKDAGTYILTDPEDHYWVLVGSTVGGGMSEVHHLDTVVRSYCSGHHYSGAKQGQDMAYYRMELKTQAQLEAYFYPHKGVNFGPFASNGVDAVKTVLWADAPADPLGLKTRFNLDDEQVHRCIQQLIWFIEKDNHKDYNSAYLHIYNLRYRYGSVYSEEVLQRMVDAMKYIWDNARYSNIPNKENMVLYAYYSISGFQNQMSVAGLNEEEYGGVKVKKVDESGNPLQGAEFTIYDSSNKAVATIVSDHEGKAMLCEYNANGGLKVGQTYTIKETKAPNGYKKSNDTFIFTVAAPNVTVSTGHRNGATETEAMVFTNKVDVPTPAGGLRIKKTSAETGKGLLRAVFGVYDSTGKEWVKLYTNQKGIAETANNFLPLGTYTVKELEAPFGFALDTTVRTVKINQDKTYVELNITDPAMKTSAVIEAKKDVTGIVPDGYQLKAGQFEFELVDAQTKKVVKTVENDADGNIKFEMNYNANDIGGNITYWLREKDSANPRYMKDTHTEEIMVIFRITDGELFADVAYEQEGGALFTNTRKSQDISGRLWFDVNKDGVQTEDEPAIENYEVCLYRRSVSQFGGDPVNIEGTNYYPAYDPEYGKVKKCTVTDADGNYRFNDVEEGQYVVVIETSDNALVSPKDAGGDDSKDSDAEKTGTHAIVSVNTIPWKDIDVYKEYPHNDIGLLILPEKFVHNDKDEDIDNEYVARESDLTYIIKFENPFNESKTFTIEDKVPENTEFVSAEDGGVLRDGTVVWVKTYGPREEIVVTWKAKAKGEEKHILNNATVTFGKTTLKTNDVNNYTPMDPVKKVYDDEGNDIDREMRLHTHKLHYEITVKNSRDIPYVGKVTDEVPKDVVVLDIGQGGKLENGVIAWDLRFAGNEEKKLTFTARLTEDSKLTVQPNTATLFFDKMSVDSNTVETPVWDDPVKAVKDIEGKDINQLLVNEGDILYYEITFTNPANDTKKFTVRDYLPEHTEFVSAEMDGQYDSASGLIEWVFDVEPHKEVTVKWQAKTVGVKTHIVNKATVSVDRLTLETNEVENWVPDDPVKQVLDELGRDANYNTLYAQDTRTLKYKLTFNNNSTLDKYFIVTDKLDKVLKFKEASHEGVYDEATHTITWKMTLKPDTYQTVEFIVEPDNVSTGSKILNDFNVKADLYDNNSNIVTNYLDDNPETVQITGVKKWFNSSGEEITTDVPEYIVVRLYSDGDEVANKRVDASTDWKFTFKQVPKNMFGKEIVYTIKEDPVPGYTMSITGNANEGFVIENRRGARGTLIVEYRDLDTNEIIAETINLEDNVDTPYSTAQKNIEGYKFVRIEENSAPVSGKLINGQLKVVYLYRKNGDDELSDNKDITPKPTPTTPVTPTPSTPGKTSTNQTITTPTSSTVQTNNPKGQTVVTGEVGYNILLPVGAGLLVLGAIVVLLKKKKEVE